MRRIVLAVAALAAVAVGQPAFAQESPRWGSFDFRVQSYRPNIDSQFGGTGPFSEIFGTGRSLQFRVDAAWTVFRRYGSLELGLSTGYWSKSGQSLSLDPTTGKIVQSADTTSFSIIPTSPFVQYRFEALAERYHVPLAPFVRLSFERYNWWTSGTNKPTHFGATNGWSVDAGLALLLDFFDSGLARELDRDTGINHTYAFVDVTHSKVDNFGSSKSWDLSGPTWALGGGLLFVF